MNITKENYRIKQLEKNINYGDVFAKYDLIEVLIRIKN